MDLANLENQNFIVAYIYKGSEKKITKFILKYYPELDIEKYIWIPKVKEIEIIKGKKFIIEQPIFDNYIFIKLLENNDPRIEFLKDNCDHIIKILKYNEENYYTLKEYEKIQIFNLSNSNYQDKYKSFIGKRFIIDLGCFKGFYGECISVNKNKKIIRGLIDIFGSKRPIDIPLDNITIE